MNSAAVATSVTEPTREAVDALRERIDALMRLVMTLPVPVYTARTSRVSGAIGAHVRHILDHVQALVQASPSRVLSYDHRARGTEIEADASVAVREMMRLDAALQRFSGRELDELIAVDVVMSSSGQSITGTSTLARELGFVMNHTIHHQAIIALLLESQGYETPDEHFGVAPSTPRRT